jgi:hypothetical protein
MGSDSSVGMALGCGLDGRDICTASRPAVGTTHHTIRSVSRDKETEVEAEHSSRSSAEIKNCGAPMCIL